MDDRLLTPREVAEALGLKPKTVLNNLSRWRQGLPHHPVAELRWVYPNGRPRLLEAELQRFMADLDRKPGSGLDRDAEVIFMVAGEVEKLFPDEAVRLRQVARRRAEPNLRRV